MNLSRIGNKAFGCLLVLASSVPISAQSPPTIAVAESVIARYARAVGGRAALTGRPSLRIKTSVAIEGMPGSYDTSSIQATPDFYRAATKLADGSVLEAGFWNDVAWANDALRGARILSGAERDEVHDEAAVLGIIRDASTVRSVTSLNRSTYAGVACTVVRIEWRSGRVTRDCYSDDTGLLVASIRPAANGSAQDLVSTYAAYRDFSGILLPAETRTVIGGRTMLTLITSVTFEPITRAERTPPAAVVEIVKRTTR